MFSLDDTIVAVSTAAGEGGIGIVRLSGPDAPAVLSRLLVPGVIQPCRLQYGHIVDPANGRVVDEVLAVHMPAPRTYTRQDVVEIDAHGGIVAVQRILALCLAQGARLAEPGEFTLRAFLNGRLDLAQAEAVLDVVRARTDRALEAAVGQLAGHLSDQIRPLRADLVQVLAYVEASIDFPEDEIGERDVRGGVERAAAGLERLLATADRGIIYRHGVRAAIVGRPNVGKSSLLNRLLRANRAIVTDIPGTTRDTLEETINLDGIPVVLVDTAGIAAEPGDPIEQLGIERSRQALAQADLALLVVDAAEPVTDADRAIAAAAAGRPLIVVANKIDRLANRGGAELYFQAGSLFDGGSGMEQGSPAGAEPPVLGVSALGGEGIDALEQAIVGAVLSGQVSVSDVPLVSSPRHKEALGRALDRVRAAQGSVAAGLTPDLVAADLSAAVAALGEITGQTAGEDLIETIFRNFCIGK